ncbi:hypothetical protein N431DRAFT_441916 [Stipitochalara longipes BDJ]|nr:hypothetical protein N431DRAFT_441916 [Stipitochalara longipes BDJ]
MATSPSPTLMKRSGTVNSVIKWLEDINLNDKQRDLETTDPKIMKVAGMIEENGHTSQPRLTEFTIFSNLPAELRLKIWRLSIPGARIVTITSGSCENKKKCPGRNVCLTQRPMARSRDANEFSAARTNRESRQEVLRTHRFSFTGDLKHPIYFNFKQDTLFFENELALQQFDAILGPNDRAKRLYNNLRHVMVGMKGAYLENSTDDVLGKMVNLESMRIVVSSLCRRSITSMGLENERMLHEAYLQSHWSKNGTEVFPTVALHSLTQDGSGEVVVGEPLDGSWGNAPDSRGYRVSRRLVFGSHE